MKKGVLSALSFSAILAISALSDVPAARGQTGKALIAEIQNRYEQTQDLEAGFTQEYFGKAIRKPQKAEGKVYLKKKGMMRWDYKTPNQKLISDGRTLWYYQPDEKQALVSDVAKVLREKTPLSFLAGEGDLMRDFELASTTEGGAQKEEPFVLELVPKESQSAVAKLILTVDRKTFFVTQAEVVDNVGNTTRTRFFDIRTNNGLPNALFQFSAPPGTEVIRMQEPAAPAPGGRPSKK